MQGNNQCHTNHEDEAGRGRGARLSMRPLQVGENKCIFLIIIFFMHVMEHYSTSNSKQEIIIGIL